MKDYSQIGLIHDPIHGYIPFGGAEGTAPGEACERDLIDHRWVQRLRQIHQLQTAWLVFPSAEHTRFQHVIGAMHLATRAVDELYESLAESDVTTPSRHFVTSLMRIAALLHDVGHGPFGHFFDDKFLSKYGQTHETLGSKIITEVLGETIRGIRRHPGGAMASDEQLDPAMVAYLVVRPRPGETDDAPRWLRLLRSLFCGIYTVDNMDFVLRDAYMSGYSTRAFDLDRLLHYSFFTEAGLTIHSRGLESLVRFMSVRSELFRSIYFHRTVRAIDLSLGDLFTESADLIFEGNPAERLDDYLRFTEWSLLVDVASWDRSDDERKRAAAPAWRDLLDRRIRWQAVCQRSISFGEGEAEASSVFGDPQLLEAKLRGELPAELRDAPLRVDIARHLHRPYTRGAAQGRNFLYDASRGKTRPLTDNHLFRRLPISHRICRVYAESTEHAPEIGAALDAIGGDAVIDELTNV